MFLPTSSGRIGGSRSPRSKTMAAELDWLGPAIVEHRVDRCPDSTTVREHVVDQRDRHAFERKIQPGGLDHRLRVERLVTARMVMSSRWRFHAPSAPATVTSSSGPRPLCQSHPPV